MRMFTFQQLKYVLEVIKWNSISEASRRLFITQPALSNSIRALEDTLGITVFDRTKKGISLTAEGSEFAAHARQVVQQAEMLADKYNRNNSIKQYFRISTQHYSFAVDAFVELLNRYSERDYEFSFHETRTFEVITDVKNMTSEIGILYISGFNAKIITKLLRENSLDFKILLRVKPHVLVGRRHPLAGKKRLRLDELAEYPYVSFEQGEYNSLYFSEETVSAISCMKQIKANDRAALLSIIAGTDAFTISSGIVSEDLNGNKFVAVSLEDDEDIKIGLITHQKVKLSPLAEAYLEILEKVVKKVRITAPSAKPKS